MCVPVCVPVHVHACDSVCVPGRLPVCDSVCVIVYVCVSSFESTFVYVFLFCVSVFLFVSHVRFFHLSTKNIYKCRLIQTHKQ